LLPIFVIIAAVYVIICATAFFLQNQLIYHPYKPIAVNPKMAGLEFREQFLESPDGVKFAIWEIPADSAKISVVYFYGNAENISNSIETYRQLHELGANVYAFEYRGYGNSLGKPSEKGISTDLQTFSEYLSKSLAHRTKVVAMGRSLGGAFAVKFAELYPVDGLILLSTFNRMSDVARSAFPYLPISLLLREQYDSEEIIRKFDKPLLSAHSLDDEVIPYALGRKLFDAAIGEKTFLEIQGSHNSCIDVSAETLRFAYRDLFNRL
jgi:uncharacterized protein